jgi:unsaturated chondroitin disaccharide hydrolase
MIVDTSVNATALRPALARFWELSAHKLDSIAKDYDEQGAPPVVTVEGKYVGRGWTDWTLGFRHGSALLQFDGTGDERFLQMGRTAILQQMPCHLTNFGVHDHGFNIVSTYGNLWRLMDEGRAAEDAGDRRLCEYALRVSGAVQARRWTALRAGQGFIYSFNGPHSLFIDTVRTLRSLALAHLLGHVLIDEAGHAVALLERLKQHLVSTVRYNVYYGEGRDIYDVPGRVAHEALFSTSDGSYRCPSTQQGYSPFSTWARGLAWAMCGLAEQLEFLGPAGEDEVSAMVMRAARATCDYYVNSASAADGVPYWDTGAPGLTRLGDWRSAPADPFNAYEPVDSSAAAVAAQGLLRLGNYLGEDRYVAAGLCVARSLLAPPYLSECTGHQGLLLHSVYHRPNGWDHVPCGRSVPCGESSMWGDYHMRELALLIGRLSGSGPYTNFFNGRAVTAA